MYVVWRDDTNPDNPEIFFTASNDNGQTFSTPINLSNTTDFSIQPQITAEGNNVYVVWSGVTPDSNNLLNIFFAASNDNGQTFSIQAKNISNNAGSSFEPQISSEGSNVYVVWRTDFFPNPPNVISDIFFAESNNNGQTFDTAENLSNNTGFSQFPQISSEGDNLYVAWDGSITGFPHVFFASSPNNGQTFRTPANLSNPTGNPVFLQISSEGNNVYVVWDESRFPPVTQPLLLAASNDSGQTFNPPEAISNNTGTSPFATISSEGNNVYVVWINITTPFNPEIFFSASNNNGQNFTSINLSNNPAISVLPQISTNGNNVYVVWEEGPTIPSNRDIFFTVSNNNGQNFSSPSENLSESTALSANAQISSSVA